ncbi:MAG: GNAT family protein [Varibaculum sp.]|nr:GNAT family protein [Varibaculum sp.]
MGFTGSRRGALRAFTATPQLYGADPSVASIALEPMRRREYRIANMLRLASRDWLAPWDATDAPGFDVDTPNLETYIRNQIRDTRRGTGLGLLVYVGDEPVGQVSLFGVQRGSTHSAAVGYWISADYAGLGIMPISLALVLNLAFGPLGLHRVEVNIRPENRSSLRVVEKLGLRSEGVRERYIHIAGEWADHVSYAATVEETPEGGWLRRLRVDTTH